ncbi:MAG: hypothetical protein H0W64_11435 [Gammaproteobacteria bacterium]|nr:hypothetical protein [Gammaproteobacteria bacterium]
MKKNLLVTLFSFTLIAATQSNAAAFNDICLQIPGHWEGSFTLKNPKDCRKYDGCTHATSAEVKHTTGINYALLIESKFGQSELSLLCENGKVINIPNVKLTCNDNGCTVRYKEARFSVELNKR